MKIAAYHRALGDKIVLCRHPSELSLSVYWADKIYISCIFSKNKKLTESLEQSIAYMKKSVTVGGYGASRLELPGEIEHIMPDYGLYNVKFSMGFTTRGCIRKCPWCVVPDKEGAIRVNAPISEFHNPDHKKVVLLDNNILPIEDHFKESMEYLSNNGLKVSFSQGLDIRLINEENAGLLSDSKYYNWKFSEKSLYFAFDEPSLEQEVRDGVTKLNNAGVPSKHIMVYMLCGFNTTFQEDYHRYKVLWEELGALPFVMVYNQQKTPILGHFARWVNRRVHKICAWEDYDKGDSQEVIKASVKA